MIVEDHVRIRIAPGADLSADPGTWPWVDITGRWRKRQPIVITSGRRDEGGSASPASCTITFDGRDGALWSRNPLGPWFGTLGVNTPLQVLWEDPAQARFDGLISELPPRRDQSGNDSTVTVRADGRMRERQQGEKALESALYRSVSTHPKVVAYWPMEDGQEATSFASPIDGVNPMFFTGDAQLAGDDPPGGSAGLPTFGEGVVFLGKIPVVPDASTVWDVCTLFRVDDAPSEPTTALRVGVSSTLLLAARIQVGNDLFQIDLFDPNLNQVSGVQESLHPDFIGRWVWLWFHITQFSGSWNFQAAALAADTGQELNHVIDSQDAGGVAGRLTTVGIINVAAPDRRSGHISVFNGLTPFEPNPFADDAPSGYAGELAADRFDRLCQEEGLACQIVTEPTPPSGGMAVTSGGDNARTPDHSSLDITGDIDIRIEYELAGADNPMASALKPLADKSGGQGDISWSLDTTNSGTPQFRWSADGTSGGGDLINASFGSVPPFQRHALRVTLDVNDGAGNHVVRFYRAIRIDAPWSLVDEQIIPGVASLFDSDAELSVGTGQLAPGRFYAFELRDGIDGTVVANPVFTDQAVGTTAFTDDAGRPWTLVNAAIVRPDTTIPMGPQRPKTLTALFREVEVADGGIRADLVYRTRRSLYNQDPPPLAVSQRDGELPAPPEPTDDDQRLRNDVTVQRTGGSSRRVVQPPGNHEETVEANVATDRLAGRLAEHRLSLGTVDEYRWPRIDLALHKQTHLIPAWLELRTGDRLTVDHVIPQLLGVDIDLIVEGWSERIGHTTWDVELNCAPASPYRVAVFGEARFGAERSTAAAEFKAGLDTSLSVATDGVLWTTDAGFLPLVVETSGVRLNVTAIAGSSSPQTFTVDAEPVNGVHKTIQPGEKVTLADRPRFGW